MSTHQMDWPSPQILLYKNKAILAERQRWPDGALAECRRIDRDHPGWDMWWMSEWSGHGDFDHAEGWTAEVRSRRRGYARSGRWPRGRFRLKVRTPEAPG